MCPTCRVVRYCCREHQKAHWKAHKTLCKPKEALQAELAERYVRLFQAKLACSTEIAGQLSEQFVTEGMNNKADLFESPEHSADRVAAFAELGQFLDERRAEIQAVAVAYRGVATLRGVAGPSERKASKAAQGTRAMMLEVHLEQQTTGTPLRGVAALDMAELKSVLKKSVGRHAFLERVLRNLREIDAAESFLLVLHGRKGVMNSIQPVPYPEDMPATPVTAFVDQVASACFDGPDWKTVSAEDFGSRWLSTPGTPFNYFAGQGRQADRGGASSEPAPR